MKTYSKIVGVILTLSGIIAFIAIIFGVIDENDIEDKVLISLLFIPSIMFLYYMFIHNFGFNLKSEIPIKNYRKILIFAIMSLIISLIVPAGYLFSQITLEKNANKMIDRGTDETTNKKIRGELKTKYENGKIYYILKVDVKNTSNKTFTIEFKDKDGFKVEDIEIKEYVRSINEKTEQTKIISNSSKWMSLKKYLKINNWDIIYRTNETK